MKKTYDIMVRGKTLCSLYASDELYAKLHAVLLVAEPIEDISVRSHFRQVVKSYTLGPCHDILHKVRMTFEGDKLTKTEIKNIYDSEFIPCHESVIPAHLRAVDEDDCLPV